MKNCFFNTRSSRNKIDEISDFVNINNVDILAVAEIWFNHLDRNVTLPGFQPPFRKDCRIKGGRVCVFVSNQKPCIRRTDLESENLELVWIQILESTHAQYYSDHVTDRRNLIRLSSNSSTKILTKLSCMTSS